MQMVTGRAFDGVSGSPADPRSLSTLRRPMVLKLLKVCVAGERATAQHDLIAFLDMQYLF